MDLAVSCCCLDRLTPMEIESTKVTWDMLKDWDISPEELFRLGEESSRRQLPPMIEPMSDVLKSFLVEEFLAGARENMEKALEEAQEEYMRLFGIQNPSVPEIYVLSNELRIGGAAVIFYTDVLGEFAEEIGSSLILLPSSIHEWLVLPDSGNCDLTSLENMVREANRKVVMEDEVLSDHIYYYSINNKTLTVLNQGVSGEEYGQKTGQKQ